MSVSVVIVSWEGWDDLRQCLASIEQQTRPADEVIVVDNGSSDGTVDHVREQFPSVQLEAMHDNVGFAEACNVGIGRASGDWIATLNADTKIEPHWLERLHHHAVSASARVGMLQSHIEFMDQPGQINSRGLALTASGQGVDIDFQTTAHGPYEVQEIFCPTAGAAWYRRSMLEQVRLDSGYFDAGFFMYGEDLDLGWRCRLAGWTAEYVPGAMVFHRFQASSRKRGDQFAAAQVRRNRVRWTLKNASKRFVLRNALYLVYDLLLGVKYRGIRSVSDHFGGIWSAWAERGNVSRMAITERRALEKRWVGRSK